MLRYKRHCFRARGIHAATVAAEFQEHAAEELGHADRIADRIVQLGGESHFSAKPLLARSYAEYVEGRMLLDMIKEKLDAERIAINSYREMVRHVADDDPSTRRLIEPILAVEEERDDELSDLVAGLPAPTT